MNVLKTVKTENAFLHGRQVVVFLAFVNFSSWFMTTFELPRTESYHDESRFYGVLTWIVLERITVPVCIFFRFLKPNVKLSKIIIISFIDRFHSTVVLFDSWKNSYRRVERRLVEESFHKRHDVGHYGQYS